jgi:hypothetical protein
MRDVDLVELTPRVSPAGNFDDRSTFVEMLEASIGVGLERTDAPVASTVSADDGSVCSMPSHDGGRTRYAPNRSLGTNLPTAQSPRDPDDELPLQVLHS